MDPSFIEFMTDLGGVAISLIIMRNIIRIAAPLRVLLGNNSKWEIIPEIELEIQHSESSL